MERLFFLLQDFFIIVWTFGLATNGTKRENIIGFGKKGILLTLCISIVISLYTKSLFTVGLLYEGVLVFVISLSVFSLIFRNIRKGQR